MQIALNAFACDFQLPGPNSRLSNGNMSTMITRLDRGFKCQFNEYGAFSYGFTLLEPDRHHVDSKIALFPRRLIALIHRVANHLVPYQV